MLLAVATLAACEVRPRPTVHEVEYQSQVFCAETPTACPWEALEAQAEFAPLVNCLLTGATVLLRDGEQTSRRVVTPTAPQYGYERHISPRAERPCPHREGQDQPALRCRVASQRAERVTWASCDVRSAEDEPLRGGESLAEADELAGSTIVTGRLAAASNAFAPPTGLKGPDHFYRFPVKSLLRVEIAVAANASSWSPTAGHRSPWQPGLYLLDETGRLLDEGRMWRGGVSYLAPRRLAPGRYVVVVDSTPQELNRGDGTYRLYVGLDQHHLGPLPSPDHGP